VSRSLTQDGFLRQSTTAWIAHEVFLESVENCERKSTRKQAIISFERLLVHARVKLKGFDVGVKAG
jgi:hypothetical protein